MDNASVSTDGRVVGDETWIAGTKSNVIAIMMSPSFVPGEHVSAIRFPGLATVWTASVSCLTFLV